MSVPINEALFQTGTVEQRFFSKDCETGDTELFDIGFPVSFPPSKAIRVIVTANNLNVRRGDLNAAVVGMAQKVTADGFVLRARNSDCADAGGFAGVNWMAGLETPGTQQKTYVWGCSSRNPSAPIAMPETQETLGRTSVHLLIASLWS